LAELYSEGLFVALYNCEWSCVNENPVDYAVYNFTAIVSETINEAIPPVKAKGSTFPH
jgi:hypothetical protein